MLFIKKKIYMIKILRNNAKSKNLFPSPVENKTVENKSRVGEMKYMPSFAKEWNNVIYSYNKYNMLNIPIDNVKVNRLINQYFLLSFKTNRFIGRKKRVVNKYRAFLLGRIHLSKPYIKYTNSKTAITLFSFNVRKSNPYSIKMKAIYRVLVRLIIKKSIFFVQKKLNTEPFFVEELKNTYQSPNVTGRQLFFYKLNIALKWIRIINFHLKLYIFFYKIKRSKFSKRKKLKFSRLIKRFRKFKYLYNLYKYKFDKTKLIPILTKLLNNILPKKIEYNIINLKYLSYSPDIFTKAIGLKLRKKRIYSWTYMKRVVAKAKLPIYENLKFAKLFSLAVYKRTIPIYREWYLVSSLNSELSYFLKNGKQDTISIIKDSDIYKLVFDQIHYKEIRGIRIQVKGRITKRYRADRTKRLRIFKGGLRDINSSLRGLSTYIYRGSLNSNMSYSMYEDNRHIGTFAVKGWISSK